MKTFFKLLMPLACLALISCGQKTNLPMQVQSGAMSPQSPVTSALSNASRRGATMSTQGISSFYSGTTGSPTNASVSGAGLSYNSPASGTALFGLNNQTSATDPQQCANQYARYPRYSGNFDTALAELATCLNQVMISQNPTLFQQYQTLQQNSYYPYSN
ncbi:MAG: hypothetical protein ACKN9V_03800 [Pseudomonadota bacterium]